MAYQVLARKWRPTTFDEVLGQNHVIRSLKNSVSSNRLAQSYLLSGTRGVGKTTIARIMAKALRCEKLTDQNNPCNSCDSCKDVDTGSSLDVIEVDGASNNSVENIRELISTLHYSPTFGEKRVVIIDEVHMLSISAFNALLKTLEEPPAHVIFIFATTEPHKIPKTVLSRVQQFDLRDIKHSEMKEQLKTIAKAEEFSFEGTVQETLCSLANGSMRDLLSAVEQLLLFSENRVITEEIVRESLGILESTKIKLLVDYIYDENVEEIVKELDLIFQSKINLEHLVFSLCEALFLRLKVAIKGSSSEEHFIFETFSKDSTYILNSISPELSFSALILKLAKRSDYFKKGRLKLKNSPPENKQSSEKVIAKLEADNISGEVESSELLNTVDIDEPVVIDEEKNITTAQTQEVDVGKTEEVKEILISENLSSEDDKSSFVGEKNFENFSDWLVGKSPALSSTIEQGNFTSDLNDLIQGGKVTLKFEEDSSVFYEHIQETNGEIKLKKFLSEFFQKDEIQLDVQLIEPSEKESFKSMADIKEDEYQQVLLNRENDLRESELVKLAQEMFNSKLDKVVPNKEL